MVSAPVGGGWLRGSGFLNYKRHLGIICALTLIPRVGICFLFPHCMACRILVSQPGIRQTQGPCLGGTES